MSKHDSRNVSTTASLSELYAEVSGALHRIHSQRSAYRQSRYGWAGKIYSWFGLFNTDKLRKSHWNVNCWTNEEAFTWKEACMASHNFVMVAATIFASLGLFSQTQTSMQDTHWSARALLSASMVCGIVSVVAATMIQESLRRLHSHMDIRLWLSNGTSTSHDRYDNSYNILPLESSVAAQKLVDAPAKFLVLAVALYIVGFGEYLLFGWVYALGQPTSDFRNIFIVYVAVVCICVFYFLSLGVCQALDGQRLQERLKTDRYAPRIQASREYQNLERIIALLVELRKKNEEKLQVGTASIDDSGLVLDLLLQLWDETWPCAQGASRRSTVGQGTGGPKYQELVHDHGDSNERGIPDQRGVVPEKNDQGEHSNSRSVPGRVATDPDMAWRKHSCQAISARDRAASQ